MIPAVLASSSSIAFLQFAETIDSTTMTHGTDGAKVPSTGYHNSGIPFGSLANNAFRASTINQVSTGVGLLTVNLSGNRAQSYFDRLECVLGTFGQATATYSYDSGSDSTTWMWSSASSFASSGTSTVDLIY